MLLLRLAVLFALVMLTCALSLLVGGTVIEPGAVLAALTHPHGSGDATTIVWLLRLPRVAIGAAVGACLGIAGALLQGMLRNPLVDPYLTGVSAGAAAAISLAIIAGVAAPLLPLFGFAAGLLAAIIVAALARRGSGIDANRLILAGISLSAFFSAISALAIARADSIDAAQRIFAWIAGSMAGRGWGDLLFASPYALAGALLAMFAAPALDTMRVGDVRARAVGLNVEGAQWTILSAASLLAAASVTLAGIVGFVGLIVPHIARRAVGSRAIALLPASAALGSIVCVAADTLARSIVAPSELPIGVLLSFAGVPAFLYLYLKRERLA